MNPVSDNIVEHCIKRALEKETNAKFRVKFSSYTLSSLKKGIFKSIEIEGEDVQVENITLPYVHLRSISDYNYIDYKNNSIGFKSNMEYDYNLVLSEDSINAALSRKEYTKVLDKVNNIAYPLFVAKSLSTKIMHDRMYLILTYNFPIAPSEKDKKFVTSSKFEVVDGEVFATDVRLDSVYKNISARKVANLINLLNPLEFMLELIDSKKYKGKIQNVNIVDNIVKVNGRIYIKGD